ncbi:unnamed protein product [Rotaria sp. Silwood1]|nr:unnamed protein product [Rotaria sp. Silwood1]CAF3876065.1 unnamed protein product [Rotaria sp. Silwood1]
MSPGGGDYWPNQPFLHLNGDLTRCTEAQLREAGYTPPPNPIYPRHPVPIERTVEEPALDQTAHIYIRCLQPPPLPPGTLTVVEKRPDPHPVPPNVTYDPRPPLPQKPPALYLRERPPRQPHIPPDDKCVYVLPVPIPPTKSIHHRYMPAPPLPRDIFIDRWLPHKRSRPSNLRVIPAPPFNPEPVQDEIITHHYAPARVQHEIHKDTQLKPENPYTYEQQPTGTLLEKYELQHTLFDELTRQGAARVIVS